MNKTINRPRIEMGEAPQNALKLSVARRTSGEYTGEQQAAARNRIEKASTLCFDPTKTNREIASAIDITRRQVSRLRHGCQAAWDRLA
jgi:hypothetical protein